MTAILRWVYWWHSTKDLRHPMIEGLMTNLPVSPAQPEVEETEQLAFLETPLAEYAIKRD